MAEVGPTPGDSRSVDSLRQLPLGIRLRDDATLDNFKTRPALAPVLAALRSQATEGEQNVLYLHGPPGSGKSHLLQGVCHLAGAQALFLPLAELAPYAAQDVLQGMAGANLLCLDDVDAVLGRPDWERALFNLYNQAQQAGGGLVIAANAAPRALHLELDDLRSRLSAAVVFHLAQASDEEKAAILRFRAERRGMSLAPEVASYIVARAPRELDALLAILDTLDRASLERQRALSIPFVREALGW